LTEGLGEAFRKAGIAHALNRVESLFSLFFTEGPVRGYGDVKAADHDRYARFFHAMLDAGIHLPPSGYETWVIGTAHGDDEIARTLEAATSAAASL